MPKLALITGANRGIGRSTACTSPATASTSSSPTARTPTRPRPSSAEIDRARPPAVALAARRRRVSSFDAFAAAVARDADRDFDRDTFDYLVNNGGMSRDGMIADVTEADVDALVDVHFKGVLFLTQKLLPLLADGGSIVNLSSGLARFTAPQRAVYGSIKGAVEVAHALHGRRARPARHHRQRDRPRPGRDRLQRRHDPRQPGGPGAPRRR